MYEILRKTSPKSFLFRFNRRLWHLIWILFFMPTPSILFFWRAFLLRCFGANIGKNVRIYSSAKIWAPWNLTMKDNSCLGRFVDCYCVDKIYIGKNAIVSQYSFLCTGGHDIRGLKLELVTSPIFISDKSWVAADAFIGPGVNIGEGAVVGARAAVFKDVKAWTVVGGNPARFIKKRVILDSAR